MSDKPKLEWIERECRNPGRRFWEGHTDHHFIYWITQEHIGGPHLLSRCNPFPDGKRKFDALIPAQQSAQDDVEQTAIEKVKITTSEKENLLGWSIDQAHSEIGVKETWVGSDGYKDVFNIDYYLEPNIAYLWTEKGMAAIPAGHMFDSVKKAQDAAEQLIRKQRKGQKLEYIEVVTGHDRGGENIQTLPKLPSSQGAEDIAIKTTEHPARIKDTSRFITEKLKQGVLPEDAKARKGIPIATGFIDYFPDAICAVAQLSQVGNDQHNPGTALHWDRAKSGDESDALMRHFIQRKVVDKDEVLHATKVAWRAMAFLQKMLEE